LDLGHFIPWLLVDRAMLLTRLDGKISKSSDPTIHSLILFLNTFSCVTTDVYFISVKIKIIE